MPRKKIRPPVINSANMEEVLLFAILWLYLSGRGNRGTGHGSRPKRLLSHRWKKSTVTTTELQGTVGNSEIKKNFIQVEKKNSPSLLYAPLQAEVWMFFLRLRLPFRTVVERRALALKEDFSVCKALFRSGILCKEQNMFFALKTIRL